ncbi:MAG: hypothetical protein KKA48_07255 [Proteobacteria bacterium]|nr:hypothetical protein [Pseudomonadota bacterium]
MKSPMAVRRAYETAGCLTKKGGITLSQKGGKAQNLWRLCKKAPAAGHVKGIFLHVMIDLPGFKPGADLKSGIDNADEANQNDETRREEIHDEFNRVVKVKCPDDGLYAEYEKNN